MFGWWKKYNFITETLRIRRVRTKPVRTFFVTRGRTRVSAPPEIYVCSAVVKLVR